MTEVEAQILIEDHVETSWGETPVVYSQMQRAPEGEHITLELIPVGTTQTSIDGGNPGWRSTMVIQVGINIPVRKGTRRAVELGDQISALFLTQTFPGLIIRDKRFAQLETDEFYRRIVMFNCFFTYTH